MQGRQYITSTFHYCDCACSCIEPEEVYTVLRRYKTHTWINETEIWRSKLTRSHNEMPLKECVRTYLEKNITILTFNMEKLLLSHS